MTTFSPPGKIAAQIGVAYRPSRRRPEFRPMVILGLVLVFGLVLVVTQAILNGEPGEYSAVTVVPLLVVLGLPVLAWLKRRHPDEPYLFKLLLAGLIFKLICSLLRYLTLKVGYGGVGDASQYDNFGRRWAAAFFGGYERPQLADASQTNFVRYLTGILYVGTGGPTIIGGFLVYGYAAYWGSYLWFRAAADSIPTLNKRMFLGIVMFLPSIAFWPSSIGKEALMNLGLGGMAYGSSLLLRRRPLPAVLVLAPSALLVNVVRPHLTAIFGIGLSVAYLFGRLRSDRPMVAPGLTRMVGIVVVLGASAVFVQSAAEFLDIQGGISRSSIEDRLAVQSGRNDSGGSQFDTPPPQLSVSSLPMSLFTVLFRPLPYEASSGFMAISALENSIILGAALLRIRSLGASVRNLRKEPFLLFCLLAVIMYGAVFSSFGNFGLLVRQRSLALPAFFVMFCRQSRGQIEQLASERRRHGQRRRGRVRWIADPSDGSTADPGAESATPPPTGRLVGAGARASSALNGRIDGLNNGLLNGRGDHP